MKVCISETYFIYSYFNYIFTLRGLENHRISAYTPCMSYWLILIVFGQYFAYRYRVIWWLLQMVLSSTSSHLTSVSSAGRPYRFEFMVRLHWIGICSSINILVATPDAIKQCQYSLDLKKLALPWFERVFDIEYVAFRSGSSQQGKARRAATA